jgi:hypothetical protein
MEELLWQILIDLVVAAVGITFSRLLKKLGVLPS